MSTDLDPEYTEVVTPEAVAALVAAKTKELGGPAAAAAHWGVSTQMVYLVGRNDRRPTPAMLADIDIKLKQVPAVTEYVARKVTS